MEWLQGFFADYGVMLAQETWNTILMMLVPTAVAYLVGIPIGVLLLVSAPGGLRPHRVLNAVLGWIVNIGRSIPFVIFIVVLIPATRIVMGTSLGVAGAIFPLAVAAIPFMARMVEQSLAEVDSGLIEAAQSFGANIWQIVMKVYLKESVPSLLRGAAISLITLLGYSAIAGMIGAGGLGDVAVRYGYQRYEVEVMIAAVLICIVLVQIIQSIMNVVVRRVDKRSR
ncbi:methionine ABC transporter permease [Raoultibacter timonensis]|uniref:Methionine ABC transporter permease n=1 Tax=Raoultibacter timonensis TaxID=1907662 RepID=A0ABN6MDF8_9ACTN|nr:methionine ABC transporter permease [Raoultibacter timonensis]BDE96018.1 methionine ABC transporter permease [Raoultibacter timonensis]BDF50622.1 methionine ABC transporter permease [Raoultibacter timonensis]